MERVLNSEAGDGPGSEAAGDAEAKPAGKSEKPAGHPDPAWPLAGEVIALNPEVACLVAPEEGAGPVATYVPPPDGAESQLELSESTGTWLPVAERERERRMVARVPETKERRARPGPSQNRDFNDMLKAQAEGGVWQDTSSAMINDRRVEGVWGAIAELDPADPIEGMLITQIVSTHNAAMQCFTQAQDNSLSFERQCEYRKDASRLMRSFNQSVEALNRYRGKGRQHITVERVNVSHGGQAVVGVSARSSPRRDREE